MYVSVIQPVVRVTQEKNMFALEITRVAVNCLGGEIQRQILLGWSDKGGFDGCTGGRMGEKRNAKRVLMGKAEGNITTLKIWVWIFPIAQQPLLGEDLLIIEASRSHSDAPYAV
jgi:hypothetical protein